MLASGDVVIQLLRGSSYEDILPSKLQLVDRLLRKEGYTVVPVGHRCINFERFTGSGWEQCSNRSNSLGIVLRGVHSVHRMRI